jgi:glucose/arabinose dehydrogenase
MKILLPTILFMFIVMAILYTLCTSSTGHAKNADMTRSYYSQIKGNSEGTYQNLVTTSDSDAKKRVSKTYTYSNPNFTLFDNQSGLLNSGPPQFWNDQFPGCNTIFNCKPDFSTGWRNNPSLQISTTNNTNNTWSSIYGKEIGILPKQQFQLVSHMRVNEWAKQSHIALEGFNKSSKGWYQIAQCPSGINGPLEWREFSCEVTIPSNTNKIRPVLNAGWSSDPTKQATTWFDSVYLINVRKPVMSDQNLKAELVFNGLESPSSVAFLGPNDILVLDKNNGTVQRIVNGVKLREPLIDLDVASQDGLLGIAIEKNITTNKKDVTRNSTYVFLYFTAAKKEHEDIKEGKAPLGNRLYRYELVNNTLVNPKLLLKLPAGFMHNGGPIKIGPDKNVYIMVGQARDKDQAQAKSKALNHQDGNEPDGRGGILRVNEDGSQGGTNAILGEEKPLNKYYAYGIRNSFGMDFDPITGKLWDTENGPDFGDEINLVDPGFNSGWNKVQGVWTVGEGESRGDLASEKPDNLVDFDGMGKYSAPEFTWHNTVAPTALKFLTTDKLGKDYKNDMFVGDAKTGRIYHFELNQNRTELLLNGSLRDKVGNTYDELDPLVFARGFGLISDLEIGPDGYLYVVVLDDGKIFRIVSNDLN